MAQEARLSVGDAEVLLTCSTIEKECGQIYWYFSKLFAGEARVRKLWQKTAIEEDGHAEQCMLAYHLRGKGMTAVRLGAATANALLAKVHAIHTAVQRTPPTLKDALRLAIMLEENLAKCHIEEMVVFEDQSLQKLFASMRKVEHQHAEMLQHAYDSLSRGH